MNITYFSKDFLYNNKGRTTFNFQQPTASHQHWLFLVGVVNYYVNSEK
jgi:hypothetical protein